MDKQDRIRKINKAHGIRVPSWYAKQQCGIELSPEEEDERREYEITGIWRLPDSGAEESGE